VQAWHPIVAAKIIATIDQISHGRAGLNVVTGDMPPSAKQLAQWAPRGHEGKYELAQEWVQLIRKYWTEERVTHKGKYFETNGTFCSPRPLRMPRVVCAGQSPSGFKFTAENCDYAFAVGSDSPMALERMRLAKKVAKEAGKPNLKTVGLFTLIPGRTDQEALERVEYFNQGVDLEVLRQFVALYPDPNDEAKKHWQRQLDNRQSLMDGYMAGSYETLARRLATAVQHGDVDGIMVVVPDFVEDLKTVAHEVFPVLTQYGVKCNIARTK
jgi:pyrimidine oxygenase